MGKLKKFIITMTISLILAGCGGSETIKTDEGTVKVKEDKVEITTDDGTTKTEVGEPGKVSLPEGYPEKTTPIMEGGKITAASKNEDESQQLTYSVVFYTDKGIQEAVAFYEEVLKGGHNVQTIKTSDATTLMGEKNGYQVTVLVIPDNSGSDKLGTAVTLSLSHLAQ